MNNNQNQNKRKPQGQSPNKQQQNNTAKSPSQTQNQSPNKQQQQNDSDSLRLVKERTIFIAMSLIGYIVQITCKNGHVYEGVLHSVNSQNTSSGGIGVVLKMARKRDPQQNIITTQPTPTVLIEAKDFVSLTATGVQLDSSSTSPTMKGIDQTINTDTDISGYNGVLRERELVQWRGDSSLEESLEGGNSNSGSSNKPWDQFSTNEALFGVTSSFDEGLYTTRLDKDSEFYRANIHLAERKANEIESDKNINNLHILEERGHIQGSDFDEEERYSSVVRKGQANSSNNSNTPPRVPLIPNADKYIPPSERSRILQQNTTTTPTTAGKDSNKSSDNTKTPTTPKTNNNNNVQSPTSNTTPNKDSNNIDKPSTPLTPSTTSANPKDNSPNVSKLIFNRDNNKPNEEDHSVLGSPRDGLSPRFVEYMKVKKELAESKTPKSPLVNNKELLTSLSLELHTNRKPDILSDFNNFKLTKSNQSVDRQSQLELYKNFSNSIKSKSIPNSPSSNSPRTGPSPTNFSLTSSSKDQSDEDDKHESSNTTTTTTKDDSKTETTTSTTTPLPATTTTTNTTSTPTPTSTNSSTSSLSKFKLNPNAKTFTPSQPSTSKSIGSSVELNKSTNGTDSQSSINDIYYDSMKKKQHQLDQPSDSVSQYWIDPYARSPYDEDPYAPYQMRPIVSVPIPFYPSVPNGPPGVSGKVQGPPQMIQGKQPIYSPQGTPPRGTYPPQNPYVSFGQPPPHFQYVPQTVVFGNPQMVPPQPHHQIGPKRYYPNSQPYGPPQPTIIIPPNQGPPQQVSSPNRMISSPTYPPPYGMGK